MIKLQQGQVWKTETYYFRIVKLERLHVDYKITKEAVTRDGRHNSASKKEFCRLIKDATLVDPNAKTTPSPFDDLPPERLDRPGRIR